MSTINRATRVHTIGPEQKLCIQHIRMHLLYYIRSYTVFDMSQKLIHMYNIISILLYTYVCSYDINMGQKCIHVYTYIILSEPNHIDESLFVMPGAV